MLFDDLTLKIAKNIQEMLKLNENAATHSNPLVQAAAEFLHKELGPLTSHTDESNKYTTNHPSHYADQLSKGLKNLSTTDIKEIVNAAHTHVIGGHHNINGWAYENLSPEDTRDYDDVDGISEKGEEEMAERLTDHLHGVNKSN